MKTIEYSSIKDYALKFALFFSLWMPIASSILFRENKWEFLISLISAVLLCICCYFYSIYRYKKDNHFFLKLKIFYITATLVECIALIGVYFIKSIIIIPATVFVLFMILFLLLNKRN